MTESDLVNSPRIVLAVDPGLSGAAFKLGGGCCDTIRDFDSLEAIPRAIKALSANVTHATIEGVAARPGQGVCSMFNFGRAAGVADASLFLALPGVPVTEVWPQKWQNYFRRLFNIAKGTLFDSRAVATAILPSYAHFFRRKKDHNTADAALMAVWTLENAAA